jgi:hypothetical protein
MLKEQVDAEQGRVEPLSSQTHCTMVVPEPGVLPPPLSEIVMFVL